MALAQDTGRDPGVKPSSGLVKNWLPPLRSSATFLTNPSLGRDPETHSPAVINHRHGQKNVGERGTQNMAQHITTVTTLVHVVTEEALNRQIRKTGERDSDLAQYASNGWTLVHTHAIAGVDYTTFVDTLTRSE